MALSVDEEDHARILKKNAEAAKECYLGFWTESEDVEELDEPTGKHTLHDQIQYDMSTMRVIMCLARDMHEVVRDKGYKGALRYRSRWMDRAWEIRRDIDARRKCPVYSRYRRQHKVIEGLEALEQFIYGRLLSYEKARHRARYNVLWAWWQRLGCEQGKPGVRLPGHLKQRIYLTILEADITVPHIIVMLRGIMKTRWTYCNEIITRATATKIMGEIGGSHSPMVDPPRPLTGGCEMRPVKEYVRYLLPLVIAAIAIVNGGGAASDDHACIALNLLEHITNQFNTIYDDLTHSYHNEFANDLRCITESGLSTVFDEQVTRLIQRLGCLARNHPALTADMARMDQVGQQTQTIALNHSLS